MTILYTHTMHLSISDKTKKDIFISLFQLLKSCSSVITICFNSDNMYIQGMDKAHVCLFDIKIFSNWFEKYETTDADNAKVCINTTFFHNILSMTQEQQSINIHYEGDPESIEIDLTSAKGDFNKFFKLPLADLETELLGIPEVEYDAEFSINSKKMNEIVSQLSVFGDIMNLKCSEEKIEIISRGIGGEMMVNIPIDDLAEFSISEGDIIDISYSLNYIHKMCITTKLSSEIEFSISGELPLRIKYDLGNNSCVMFFIAPKIE